MKRNKKHITLLLAFLTVMVVGSGCDDFLTVEPKSNWVTESFYQSKSDVELGLAGVYSYLALDNTYGSLLSAQFEGGTDELLYNRTNTNWSEALYMHTPASSNIKNVWLNLYRGIDAANVFLVKVSDTPGLTDEERKQYLGEVHFLRALFYFDLVRWWGPVPLRLTPTGDIDANNFAASTEEEVYAQIIRDLEFAAANLKHAKDMDEFGHANKMAAHGILARVYLTMAGYPLNKTEMFAKANEQCDIILKDGWHKLNGSYRQVFLNYIQNKYDPQESMFEIEFAAMRAQGLREDGRIGQINGVQFYYWPTQTEPFAYALLQTGVKLVNSYSEEDERLRWNVADFICNKKGKISQITNDLLYWPGKFRRWEPVTFGSVPDGTGAYVLLEDNSSPDKNFTGINYPVLRFADVLLMKAEAENEENGPANAVQYLNQVRDRANAGDVDGALVADKDAFRAELQNERARELCYEGHRKHDLIRWNILEETLELQNQMIDESNGNAQKKTLFKRAAENYNDVKHKIMPYPLQEVTMNGKLDQHDVWQ